MPFRVGRTCAPWIVAAAFSLALPAATPDCAVLALRPLENTSIKSEVVTGGTFKPAAGEPLNSLPGFCRVRLTLTPSSDSAIQAELWLPLEGWNGKLRGIGNGGYAGSINYSGLAEALRHRYASVASDTGHEGSAEDASWALQHPEKIVDFGYRAIHLMTVGAKELTRDFYGSAITRSYFSSCSNGGREALMEAQRFPTDYDGIIAGAPANYWTHLLGNAVASVQALSGKGSFIPPAKLPAIQAAAQQDCDASDGANNSLIENPRQCHFDTSALLCKGVDSDSCLTSEQVTALNKLYAGGRFKDGSQIFPGYPPGGEASKNNWDLWITGSAPGQSLMYAFGTQFFKNMVYSDSNWDFHSFEADRDVKVADEKLAATLNSTNPDLTPFIAHGGKLILYHGWDDAAIAAPNSINYFEAVRRKIGAGRTRKAVRLFLVPGMQHCWGGNGAYSFGQFSASGEDAANNIDTALVEWVEHGKPPEKIIASKPETPITHPLCAYPKVAHYDGKGDVNSASSYTCEARSGT